jgi:hypothetical protein
MTFKQTCQRCGVADGSDLPIGNDHYNDVFECEMLAHDWQRKYFLCEECAEALSRHIVLFMTNIPIKTVDDAFDERVKNIVHAACTGWRTK